MRIAATLEVRTAERSAAKLGKVSMVVQWGSPRAPPARFLPDTVQCAQRFQLRSERELGEAMPALHRSVQGLRGAGPSIPQALHSQMSDSQVRVGAGQVARTGQRRTLEAADVKTGPGIRESQAVGRYCPEPRSR